jgi:hypothetical protein
MDPPVEKLGDLLYSLRAKSNLRLKLLEIPEITRILVGFFILNLDIGNLELSAEERKFLESDKSLKKISVKTHKSKLNILESKNEDFFTFLG